MVDIYNKTNILKNDIFTCMKYKYIKSMDFSDILVTTNTNNVIITIDSNKLFRGQLIEVYETPTSPDWKFVPIYADGLNGETLVWQIGYNSTISRLQIYNNGKTTYLLGDLEVARKMYLIKRDEGYNPYTNTNSTKGVMLPKNYKHPSIEGPLKTKEARIKLFPISIVKNLNGLRAIASKTDRVIIRNREGNEYPYLFHLKSPIANFLKYLPPGCELDGELYHPCHDTLVSAVKTTKVCHQNNKDVIYCISDLIHPDAALSWEARYSILVNVYRCYIKSNPTSISLLQAYTVSSVEELDNYRTKFIDEGCVGVMIRRYGTIEPDLSVYKAGRCNNLLRY